MAYLLHAVHVLGVDVVIIALQSEDRSLGSSYAWFFSQKSRPGLHVASYPGGVTVTS